MNSKMMNASILTAMVGLTVVSNVDAQTGMIRGYRVTNMVDTTHPFQFGGFDAPKVNNRNDVAVTGWRSFRDYWDSGAYVATEEGVHIIMEGARNAVWQRFHVALNDESTLGIRFIHPGHGIRRASFYKYTMPEFTSPADWSDAGYGAETVAETGFEPPELPRPEMLLEVETGSADGVSAPGVAIDASGTLYCFTNDLSQEGNRASLLRCTSGQPIELLDEELQNGWTLETETFDMNRHGQAVFCGNRIGEWDTDYLFFFDGNETHRLLQGDRLSWSPYINDSGDVAVVRRPQWDSDEVVTVMLYRSGIFETIELPAGYYGATPLWLGEAGDIFGIQGPDGASIVMIRDDAIAPIISESDALFGSILEDINTDASISSNGRFLAFEYYLEDGREGIASIELAAPALTCPGDIDGDGSTSMSDFAEMSRNFGSADLPSGSGESRHFGDLNDDGAVDLADFHILASDFGCTP
jgi:hypothetical protein